MGFFGRQKFSFQTHMLRKTGAENRRQKMQSIYGAGFWSMCHEYSSLYVVFSAEILYG